MPILTTNMLTKNPTPGAGPISQAVVKVVNNGVAQGTVYLTGLNNDVSPATLFAQELFESNYREVMTKTYNITHNFSNSTLLTPRSRSGSGSIWWTAAGSGFPFPCSP